MASTQQPEIRIGSYLRYKALTNQCLSWLLDTSISAGYIIPSPERKEADSNEALGRKLREKQALKNEKCKGKENPSNTSKTNPPIPSTKYIVRTKELIQQAKILAKHETTVPPYIVNAWEQAVAARKRAATWFQSIDNSSKISNSGHQHFITVLENVLKILRPHIKPDVLTSDTRSKEDEDIPLIDRVGALSIEDVQHDLEDEIPPSTPTLDEPEPEPEHASAYDFGYESSSEDSFNTEENQFAISCFFEDLHSMQAFVKETWQQYKDGLLDPLTAAFVTNAAIELARREELSLVERLFGPDQIASQTLLATALQSLKPEDLTKEWIARTILMILPFDEFVYRRPHKCILKFMAAYHWCGEDHFPYAVPSNKPYLVSQDEQYLLELPEVQKLHDDDLFLTQLLLDLHIVTMARCIYELQKVETKVMNPLSKPRIMVLDDADAFTRGIRELLIDSHRRRGEQDSTELATWLCFAGQIILDIRDVLGDQFKNIHDKFHGKLTSLAGRFVEKTDERIPAPPGWLDRNPAAVYLTETLWGSHNSWFEKWRGGFFDSMDAEKMKSELRPIPPYQKFYDMSKDSTDIAEILEASGTVEELVGLSHANAILPAKDPYFLSSIPLGCGLRSLRLDLAAEEAGISHANMDCGAFFLAYLYSAARQLGILQTPWPDMERFIELNMVALFSGKLPDKKEDFINRFRLKNGHLLSDKFCVDRNKSRIERGARLKFRPENRIGPQLTQNKISTILRDLYSEDSYTNIHQCLEKLQAIFQPTSTKPGHRQPQLSSLQLLQLLRTSLPTAIENAQFDYFTFTRTSENLLKRIRFTLVCELKVDYFRMDKWLEEHDKNIMGDSGVPEHFRELPFVPDGLGNFEMIWEILAQVRGLGGVSPQLRVVAKVVEKHIAGLGNSRKEEPVSR